MKANVNALTKGSADFFNIGTGRGTKTSDLYQIIYEAVKALRPEISDELSMPSRQEARPGDIARSCLTIEKAHNLLDWIPETDLTEGIRLTLQWRSEQPG